MSKTVFLVCTETSADLLGGSLIQQLSHMVPDLKVFGVGGDRLIDAGMEPMFHVRDFNVMGLIEVLSKLKQLRAMFKQLVERVKRLKPDLILLIDAPDFNLRLAKALRRSGIPIVYYVSPQIWAWREKRAQKIAELVDHMLVLFPFEADFYQPYGLSTTWVGHPLLDEIGDYGDRETFCKEQGLDPQKPLVALAPGSRKSVVRKLLPIMAEVARQRSDRYQFLLPKAPLVDSVLIEDLIDPAHLKILPGEMRRVMSHADAAVVASGTGTLETALLGTPMIVGYKLNWLSYLLAKWMVVVPHIALVNIVLGKRTVPELVQKEFCPEKVIPLLDELLEPEGRRREILADFSKLPKRLGGGGASRKAALVLKDYLLS